MKSAISCAVFWMSAILCMGAAHAAPTYDVTVIGGAGSTANGINSSGQVVGQLTSSGNLHAFFFDGATLNDIGAGVAGDSVALAVNDSGTVVGNAYATGFPLQSFVYTGGALTALPENIFSARGINNAGAIVGAAQFPDGSGQFVPHAFIYAGGVVTDLGLLPGNDGEGSYGYGINNAGAAVGAVEVGGAPNRPTDPFLYSGGVMQNLGNIGGVFSAAWAINDANQVVGSIGGPYLNDGNLYPDKAFKWDAGVLQTLGEFIPNGNSVAYDINNGGQIVGNAQTAGGIRAFLYAGAGMVELDSLIDPAAGWTITAASGINDMQQIAATACNLAGCYAVRLDLAPVPEPGQVAMLGLGLLALCLRRGRGRYDPWVNKARRPMVLPDTSKTPSPV
jgi:probable HAF family extracellular repeat protein